MNKRRIIFWHRPFQALRPYYMYIVYLHKNYYTVCEVLPHDNFFGTSAFYILSFLTVIQWYIKPYSMATCFTFINLQAVHRKCG